MGRKDDGESAPSGVLARLVDKLRPRARPAPSPGPDVATPRHAPIGQGTEAAAAEPRLAVVAALDELRAGRSGGPTGGEDDQKVVEPGDEERPRRVVLRLQNFQSAVDAQIAQARKRGDFDNLPGKGKPLDLREQPGEADGTWAAHRVVQGAGMQLPWVALGKEIDADLDACRKIRERIPLATSIRRRELLADYETHARAARQKTARYNLIVPVMQLQRLGVDADGMVRAMREEVEAREQR